MIGRAEGGQSPDGTWRVKSLEDRPGGGRVDVCLSPEQGHIWEEVPTPEHGEPPGMRRTRKRGNAQRKRRSMRGAQQKRKVREADAEAHRIARGQMEVSASDSDAENSLS